MKKLKARSSIKINAVLDRHGPIWQANFYDHSLRKDADRITLARYVVANPFRAKLVDKVCARIIPDSPPDLLTYRKQSIQRLLRLHPITFDLL